MNKNNIFLLKKIKQVIKNKPVFIFLFFFFLISYCILGIQKHNRFETGDDLTIYAQPIWHYSRFEPPYSSILKTYIFNDHFAPMLITLAPLYWLWPDARVLILIQQIIVVMGVIPVYLFSQLSFQKKYISLAFSFLYLYFIGIQSAVSADFHLATISATFIGFSIYFFEIKKWIFFWPFFISAMLWREDVPLYMFALGMYAISIKKEFKRGLTVVIISVLYFYSINNFILPILNGTSFKFNSLAGGGVSSNLISLIQNPAELIKSFFWPYIKIRNIFLTSFSFGFLPFFSSLYWFIAPFTFLRYTITADPIKYSLHFHYAATLTPILVFSSILVFKRIKFVSLKIIFLILAFIGTIYTNKPNLDPGFPTPPISYVFSRAFYVLPPRNEDYNKMMAMIPTDASVSAQVALLPHLCNRAKIYRFPDKYQEVQYIALTFTEGPYPLSFEEMITLKNTLLESNDYEKLYLSYAGVLLKRK